MLQIPIALILVLLLSYGCGMILATIGVFFRDMEYLWSVALMIIMYTCAIFYYPSRLLKSGFAWILKFNPLYCIISIFRSAMFGEMMNMHYFAYALIFSLVAIVVGMICFKRSRMTLYFIYNCGFTGEKNGKTGSCSRQCKYEI